MDRQRERARAVRRHRAVAVVASGVVPLVLVGLLGHRGLHAARNLFFPGAGLIEQRPLVAALLAVAAVAATVAWLRWGTDWLLAAVVVTAMAVSFVVTPAAARTVPRAGRPPVSAAAHEFPLVMLVATAYAWLKSATGRLPGRRRLAARRAGRRVRRGLDDVARLAVVDRSRCAALVLLADPDRIDPMLRGVVDAGTGPEVARRAAHVGWWARGRRGDPFAVDHAHARAALALASPDGAGGVVADLARDAEGSAVGVPASEPGWVRPLDATLAALALARAGHPEAGERWRALLAGPFGLRRGHRPAWLWTPLDLPAGRAPAWEHAACTALARSAGWVGDADWPALRARVLGAAARGTSVRDDERLVAAGRLWLAFVDDPEAARIVGRPTVANDPIAVALDRLAGSIRGRAPTRPATSTEIA